MIQTNNLYYIIASSIGVFAVLLVFVYRYLKSKKIEKKFLKAGKENLTDANSKEDDSFKKSFADSQNYIKNKIADKRYKYSIPWVLLLGNKDSGKTSLLKNLNIPSPFTAYNEQEKINYNDCDWKFFDKALMIDVAGNAVFKNDNEKQWDSFLKLLYSHKSKRPLDSIVLTIPVTDLLYTDAFTDDFKIEIVKKAQAIFNKIAFAQAKLGMSVPVYVMLTKADQIPGFSSFVSSLSTEMTKDIFGWSNPNNPDKNYTQAWIDEAFDSILSNIHKLQLEVFTEKNSIQNKDLLFQFPKTLKSIAISLKCYLNEVFKQNVYYEPFVLRGIYFSGYSEEKKAVFVQKLFEDKIFPEFGLAKPLHKSAYEHKKSLSKSSYAYIAVCSIWLIGLFFAYPMLNNRKKEVLPILQKSTELVNLQKTIKNFDEEKTAMFLKSALTIAADIERVSDISFNNIFVPPSWFSDLNGELKAEFKIIYNKVIITTLYENLTGKSLSPEEKEAIPKELQNLIIELLKQDFMKSTNLSTFPSKIERDKILVWDLKLLAKATDLTNRYNTYFTKEFEKFPSDVRSNVKMTTDRQMSAYLKDVLVSAIKFEGTANPNRKSDEEVTKELKSLNESTKPLTNLIKILRNSSLKNTGDELANLLFLHYYSMLEAIDSKCKTKGLYQFESNLTNWNGTDNLRTLLFRTEEFGKIAEDLKKMQDEISDLAIKQAKPLIEFINNQELFQDNTNLFLVEKWTKIANDIDSYPENLPSNPLVHLENFLLKDVSMINAVNYKTIILPRQLSNSDNDFFVQKEKEIAIKIFSEAYKANKATAGGGGASATAGVGAQNDMVNQKALEAYKEIKEYFNSNISGKTPFSTQSNLSAPIESFVDFYKILDKNLDSYKKTAKTTDFVNKMQSIKNFLSLKDDGNPPLITLKIEFRVNREYELNANRIIDWSFKVGNKIISNKDKNQSISWKYGDPIKVMLRWVANASTTPVKDDNTTNLKIFGKTAVYEYNDSWSLLSLIQKNSQGVPGKSELGDVLKFTINTKENLSSSEVDKTVAFITVQAFDNSAQKIKFPVLPLKAPDPE